MPRARTKQQAIAERISASIGAGRWRDGDRLPSEQELARDHDVSLGTLQKALATLAQRGVITREHGRGTFVAGRHLQPADVRLAEALLQVSVQTPRIPVYSNVDAKPHENPEEIV